MQETAGLIGSVLPPGTGFVLLAFDFGPNGRLEYVSNAKREDVVKAMIEFIAKTAAAFGEHERETLLGTRWFEIAEEERQMIALALARLAVERPGWDDALARLAAKFHASEMFDEFKKTNQQPKDKG